MNKKKFWHKTLAFSLCLMLMLSMLITTGVISAQAAISEWKANTTYAQGDLVTYSGKAYECIAAHTSLEGWQPSNVPALWKVYTGSIPTNTPTPTVTSTNTPIPTTTTCIVKGYIQSEIFSSEQSFNAGFKVELAYTDGNSHVYSATTNNDGYFEMHAQVNKTYTVKISKFGYLARIIENFKTSSVVSIGTKNNPVKMRIGDLDGNGAINMSDIMELIKYFNSAKGDGKYNASYDLNKDGAINMTDIMAVVRHFNTTSGDYPDDIQIVITTPQPTVTPTATPIPSTGLPTRIMSGYWHTWGGGPGGGVPFVKLRDVDPGWDVINIAFAEPVSPGSTDGNMKFEISGLSTVSNYTKEDFKADIKLLQSRGKKIVLSIGGYEGYFSLTSPGAVNTFVSDIKGFINEYGFDGIDIDTEQSSIEFISGGDPDFRNPKSPKIVNMISAIRQIVDSYGDDFILSWAPETYYLHLGHTTYAGLNGNVDFRAGCFIPMIHALRDKTTYVQAQLYNSGSIIGIDGKSYNMGNSEAIVAMCEMLLQGFNVNRNSNYFFPALRPDQVVIGLPSSANAAGSGQISNAGLQQAFSTLAKKYPTFRGIMAWSINWDNFQNNNSFVKSNAAYLDSLPPVGPTVPPTVIPTATPTVKPTITPTATPTPTATVPTIPPNTNLPKRVMVGYWHTWGGNNPFIKLRDVDPHWDVINIAFAEPVRPGSGDGKMQFVISGLNTVSNYTINDFKADVKMWQSKGKKVVLSIGGYEGWFTLDSQAAVSQFVRDIKSFVDEYGFDGIDIDFEQDSIKFDQGNDPYFKNPKSPRIVNAISAIRQIVDSYDDDFMLTWAPETFYLQNGISYYAGIHQFCLSKAGCYIPLIHALRDKTTFVHAQLYNSAPMMGNDGNFYNMGTTEGIVAMCEMLLDGFKIMGKEGDDYFFPPLRPDQVVIGVPASSGAAGSGQISNAGLQKAFSTLVREYPDLRGIMTWSINWDSHQNNNSFVRENRAYLNTLD